MIDHILNIITAKSLTNIGDGDLTFYELTIAEEIRESEISKEAASMQYESADTEYENRRIACQDRCKTVLNLIFNGFNSKSFSVIEALFPDEPELSQEYWKKRWAEKEREILAEAAQSISLDPASNVSINKSTLKQSFEKLQVCEHQIKTLKTSIAELSNSIKEFDEEEVEILNQLSEEKFGTADYKVKWFNLKHWSNKKLARRIESRLENKTVLELVKWWEATHVEIQQNKRQLENLLIESQELQRIAPYSNSLNSIADTFINEIESLLLERLADLQELSKHFKEKFRDDALLRDELSRLTLHNKWALEGKREKEAKAKILLDFQEKVYHLHEALNDIRTQQTQRNSMPQPDRQLEFV